MSHLEKSLGFLGGLAVVGGVLGALLGSWPVAAAMGLLALLVPIFFLAQLMREARRLRRSTELLAESVRMTRAVAQDARDEAVSAKRESVAHSRRIRTLIQDQAQKSYRRDRNLKTHLEALAAQIDRDLAKNAARLSEVERGMERNVTKEGRSTRTALREGLLEVEASTSRELDGRSKQIRTQVVDERRKIMAGLAASEIKSRNALDSATSDQLSALSVLAGKMVSLSDGLREVIDEIDLRTESASARLDNLAASEVVRELSSDVDALGHRIEASLVGLGSEMGEAVSRGNELLELDREILGLQSSVSTQLTNAVGTMGESLDRIERFAQERVDNATEMTKPDSEEVLRGVLSEEIDRLADRQIKESNKLVVAMRSETQEVEALLQLFSDIEPRWAMPSLGRWALDARSMLHLRYLVDDLKPRRVVEFGGGSSTVWLAYLCERIGAQLTSIDHHPTFLERTRSMLERHGFGGKVDLRLGELEEHTVGSDTYSWYAREAYADLDEVDLLFIDGPPSTTGPMARYPALPLMYGSLAEGAVVVLDDSDRPDERAAVANWLSEHPGLEHVQEGISRLAVLSCRGVVTDIDGDDRA